MQLPSVARILAIRMGARPAPVSVGFELTHQCNLACRYCDRHTPVDASMSTEQLFRALDQLVVLGMRTISLDGGEPLTHPQVDHIVRRLVSRGVRVNMNSNGILVPRKLDTVRLLVKLKVSLDGPRDVHDQVRGNGSFARALRGIAAARNVGVPVELTCVVGSHNAFAVDDVLALASHIGLRVVFQPERAGLFHDSLGSRACAVTDIRAAFAKLEQRKRDGYPVANRWSSLRHFRAFPRDAVLPCAAGFINATLDPYGYLYPCGQVSRTGPRIQVLEHGVKSAFDALARTGCAQCWCARVVEENFAWGGRFDLALPPRRAPRTDVAPAPAKAIPTAG
ncbi:MAG: radical SAM protein [Polyangiaceae bacterium]|jgi:MoaA/NifB/PqqE/SkfB family radical SAM enzyme|nr:radical SAM protein [Polyangiaceae bacterium]